MKEYFQEDDLLLKRLSSISQLKILGCLYSGKASSVHAVQLGGEDHSLLPQDSDRQRMIMATLKTYHKAGMSSMERQSVEREIKVHSRLRHPGIVKLHSSFEDTEGIYLVMDLSAGDLCKVMRARGGKLGEEAVIDLISGLLAALEYCHSKGITHCDIKPENILLRHEEGRRVLLTGFGLASEQSRSTCRSGNLDYMAPEMLLCPLESSTSEQEEVQEPWMGYDNKVDVWAVGVLAYELLTGFTPFHDESKIATHDKILTREPLFKPGCMSAHAKSFITSALEKDANLRPTAAQLLMHPWCGSSSSPTSRGGGLLKPNSTLRAMATTLRDPADLSAETSSASERALLVRSVGDFGIPAIIAGGAKPLSPLQGAEGSSVISRPIIPNIRQLRVTIKIPHQPSGQLSKEGPSSASPPPVLPPVSAGKIEDLLLSKGSNSQMHVLSFTARKGCIVLELEAVMHPRRPRNNNNNAAEEAAASQSERTSVGGPGPAGATTSSGLTGFDSDSEGDEATTTLDPIAWLELMQVDKLLPAGATVSIRIEEISSDSGMMEVRILMFRFDSSSGTWEYVGDSNDDDDDDLQPMSDEPPLLQLTEAQPRCLSLGANGDRKLRLHALVAKELFEDLMPSGQRDIGDQSHNITLEAVIGGKSVPVTISADAADLSDSASEDWCWGAGPSAVTNNDDFAAEGDVGEAFEPTGPMPEDRNHLHKAILEVDFSSWVTVEGDSPAAGQGYLPPWGLLRLNVWARRRGLRPGSGEHVLGDEEDDGVMAGIPPVLSCSESVVLFPRIWSSAAPDIAYMIRGLSGPVQVPQAGHVVNGGGDGDAAVRALRVSVLSSLAMVIDASLGDSASGSVQTRAPRRQNSDDDDDNDRMEDRPPLPLHQGPSLSDREREHMEGVLRTVGYLEDRLEASRSPHATRMLAGCSRLIEKRLRREPGSTGAARAPLPLSDQRSPGQSTLESAPPNAGGTSPPECPVMPRTGRIVKTGADGSSRCGIPFYWSLLNVVMFVIVYAIQRSIERRNTEHHTAPMLRLRNSALVLVLPYVIINLGYLGIHIPDAIIQFFSRRSPLWLVQAAEWALVPNVGVINHLNMLRHVTMFVLGYFPARDKCDQCSMMQMQGLFRGLSLADSVVQRGSLLGVFVLWRIMYAAFESYDVRAAAAVIALLDVPIWSAVIRHSTGEARHVSMAVVNGVMCLGVHALCAYLKQQRLQRAKGALSRLKNKVD